MINMEVIMEAMKNETFKTCVDALVEVNANLFSDENMIATLAELAKRYI